MSKIVLSTWFLAMVLLIGVFVGIIIGAYAGNAGRHVNCEIDCKETSDLAWKATMGWDACMSKVRVTTMMARACVGTDSDDGDFP